MRAKWFMLLPLMAVIITAIACASQDVETVPVPTEPSGAVIRISCAGGTTGVLKGLAEEYSKVNTDFLDLGAMSRKPKESEFETGIGYVTFAEERVAVVTSPDLPISELTVEQVRPIFSGKIDNWFFVGRSPCRKGRPASLTGTRTNVSRVMQSLSHGSTSRSAS